jgi:hypothetical protein
MKQIHVTSLSAERLTTLKDTCERLIRQQQAGLEEYELYVCCQAELVRRGLVQRARQPRRLMF